VPGGDDDRPDFLRVKHFLYLSKASPISKTFTLTYASPVEGEERKSAAAAMIAPTG
jgi:hypothetical protein